MKVCFLVTNVSLNSQINISVCAIRRHFNIEIVLLYPVIGLGLGLVNQVFQTIKSQVP